MFLWWEHRLTIFASHININLYWYAEPVHKQTIFLNKSKRYVSNCIKLKLCILILEFEDFHCFVMHLFYAFFYSIVYNLRWIFMGLNLWFTFKKKYQPEDCLHGVDEVDRRQGHQQLPQPPCCIPGEDPVAKLQK